MGGVSLKNEPTRNAAGLIISSGAEVITINFELKQSKRGGAARGQ